MPSSSSRPSFPSEDSASEFSSSSRKMVRAWGLATILVTFVILLGTSWPQLETPVPPPPGADKVVHTVFYLLLSFTFRGWQTARRKGHWALDAAMLLLFGLLDELHQIPIPGRTFAWLDVAADASGVLFGLWLARKWWKAHPRGL